MALNLVSNTARTFEGSAAHEIILAKERGNVIGAQAARALAGPQSAPGDADHTVNGSGGDDFIYGDVNNLFVFQGSLQNGAMASAESLDAASFWATGEDPFVEVAGAPHTTAFIETTIGQTEWFKFTAGAGQTVTVDIDFANGLLNHEGGDPGIRVLDPSGAVVASTITADAVSFTTPTAGLYYIVLDKGGGGVAWSTNVAMALQLSVTGHASAGAPTAGADALSGGMGNDRLLGFGGSDVLEGGEGVDYVWGGADNDLLGGGNGNDVVRGGAGGDYLDGGYGDDTFVFVSAADSPVGSAFDAIADWGLDSDGIYFAGFDPGRPFIQRVDGGSFVYFSPTAAGAYTGVIQVNSAGRQVQGGNLTTEVDPLRGVYLYGRDGGADDLWGGFGADIIVGFAGADTIIGGRGGDQLYGGAGADTFIPFPDDSTFASFDVIADFTTGVDRLDVHLLEVTGRSNLALARLGGSTFLYAGTPGATGFTDVIQVVGVVQGDDLIREFQFQTDPISLTMYGTGAGETLIGASEGRDLILAGDGADTVIGGGFADTLYGGPGADRFVYRTVTESNSNWYDTIEDFETGVDKIDLRGVADVVLLSSFSGSTFIYFAPFSPGNYSGLIVAKGVVTQEDVLVTGESGAPEEPMASAPGAASTPVEPTAEPPLPDEVGFHLGRATAHFAFFDTVLA